MSYDTLDQKLISIVIGMNSNINILHRAVLEIAMSVGEKDFKKKVLAHLEESIEVHNTVLQSTQDYLDTVNKNE